MWVYKGPASKSRSESNGRYSRKKSRDNPTDAIVGSTSWVRQRRNTVDVEEDEYQRNCRGAASINEKEMMMLRESVTCSRREYELYLESSASRVSDLKVIGKSLQSTIKTHHRLLRIDKESKLSSPPAPSSSSSSSTSTEKSLHVEVKKSSDEKKVMTVRVSKEDDIKHVLLKREELKRSDHVTTNKTKRKSKQRRQVSQQINTSATIAKSKKKQDTLSKKSNKKTKRKQNKMKQHYKRCRYQCYRNRNKIIKCSCMIIIALLVLSSLYGLYQDKNVDNSMNDQEPCRGHGYVSNVIESNACHCYRGWQGEFCESAVLDDHPIDWLSNLDEGYSVLVSQEVHEDRSTKHFARYDIARRTRASKSTSSATSEYTSYSSIVGSRNKAPPPKIVHKTYVRFASSNDVVE